MGILFGSIFTDLLVALVTLFTIIYWYFTKNFNYWSIRNIHSLKPTPFFGNFKDRFLVRKAISHIWVDIYKQLKKHKIGGVWVVNQPYLVVTDPEVIKGILVKDFVNFHDRGMPVDEKNNPLSAHLFNLAGPRWRMMRAKLSPTFTSGKMKMMYALMHECAMEFTEMVERESRSTKDVEFKELFAKMTTDIIGTCAFGLQFNSMKDPNSEFRAMGRKVFSPSKTEHILHMLYHFFPPMRIFFKIQFPTKDVSDFFLKAVHDTMSYRETNNIKRNDFLQLLIELKNKVKIEDEEEETTNTVKGLAHEVDLKNFELTENLLAAQAFVFFLAGFETSSTTLSFALHELVQNPDIQEKLREEIDAVLEETGGELTYDALRKMEYLDKVVNETLRKYPPIPTLTRQCTKAYVVKETRSFIEAGTKVEIPVYALHHDPEYYPDPDRFDPERFNEEVKSQRHAYTFLPFGEGPRLCIGMRFGLLQTKLGLASLLARFELEPSTRSPLRQELNPKAFITAFKCGVWARVAPRSRVSLKNHSAPEHSDA